MNRGLLLGRLPSLGVLGVRVLGVAFGLLAVAPWVLAQEANAAADDLAVRWGRNLAIALAVASAGLIVFSLRHKSRWPWRSGWRWAGFFGIVVFPAIALSMTLASGIEHSKSLEFCGSCHVMDPFVEDLANPDSDLLAAVHFKNRDIQGDPCYTCHTDYGMYGTLEAKIGGVRHVWKNMTQSYELPIKIYGDSYRFSICLNCHGEALNFLDEGSHEGVTEAVLAGEMECTECHETSHPAREERTTL